MLDVPSVVHRDEASDSRLLGQPLTMHLPFFLPFFQGEPGKAGEKGLAGAPGLRVSAFLTAYGLVSGMGGVSPRQGPQSLGYQELIPMAGHVLGYACWDPPRETTGC